MNVVIDWVMTDSTHIIPHICIDGVFVECGHVLARHGERWMYVDDGMLVDWCQSSPNDDPDEIEQHIIDAINKKMWVLNGRGVPPDDLNYLDHMIAGCHSA